MLQFCNYKFLIIFSIFNTSKSILRMSLTTAMPFIAAICILGQTMVRIYLSISFAMKQTHCSSSIFNFISVLYFCYKEMLDTTSTFSNVLCGRTTHCSMSSKAKNKCMSNNRFALNFQTYRNLFYLYMILIYIHIDTNVQCNCIENNIKGALN